MQFFYFLKSVQLSSIYFLSGRSPTTSYAIFYIMFMHKISSQVSGGGGEYSLWWPVRGGSARKGYLFQVSGIWKSAEFTTRSISKDREICHLGLWQGPKGLTDEFYGFIALRSHLLPLFISYRSGGEKLIKYQANSSCVIVSVIFMTTLFYKALILQGEIWCWSLLGLKGLTSCTERQ